MEHGDIVLIPLRGMKEVAEQIKHYFNGIDCEAACEIVEVELLRFATGDAKAVLRNSIRGKDVFIIVDVGRYDCGYRIFGRETWMSPDDHYQDLVRTISAIGGKSARINVVSPLLYGARQDRRIGRESLDCAVALQHLEKIGVSNIMAFDVHDDRVSNAVPFMGFDKLMPTYQIIKAMSRNYPDLSFDEDHMVMVSPDLGGVGRNHTFTNELVIDLGVFYKRRSTSNFADGKYAVEVHKYIGPDIQGKDVLIVDDIIASGETILDTAEKIKEAGAKRVFAAATFGFFTGGVEKFNEAYEKKHLDAVFLCNATYCPQDVVSAPWYKEVNILKYIAYYIYCVNEGKSISSIMDSHKRIQNLVKQHMGRLAGKAEESE